MGGRGSGGGKSASGGASKNSNPELLKGENLYKNKISKGLSTNRQEFNLAKEYIRQKVSKDDVLKLADRYKSLFDNRISSDPFSVAEFKSRELMLREIAKDKK